MDRRSFLGTGGLALAAALTGSAWVSRSSPDWESLQGAIAGTVVLPGDPAYDATRQLALEQFDSVRPQAIVLCESVEDVQEAVRFARRNDIGAVPRSGGHSFAGYSTATGMVIDVSRMRSVRVEHGVAQVQAGAQLVDVTSGLDAHGLALPSGFCPTVGIAGLAQGGGFGLDGRRHGLTVDHTLGVRAVLADGRVVDCDEHHHPDLFWALRGGGGGNFGIVTSFVFSPVAAVPMTDYSLAWPWPAAAAVLDAWQRWGPNAPDDLAALLSISLGDAAPGNEPFVGVYGTWLGAPGDLDPLLDDLVARVGTDPVARSRQTLPHLDSLMQWYGCSGLTVQECHRAGPFMGGTLPRFAFALARGNFFQQPAPPEGVAAMLQVFDSDRLAGQVRSLDLQAFGGAVNRVRPDATAFVHRRTLFYAGYSMGVAADPTDLQRETGRRWVNSCWQTMQSWSSPFTYQNFVDPQLVDWRRAYYGDNYERLVRVKAGYDPARFFRFPQSIG